MKFPRNLAAAIFCVLTSVILVGQTDTANSSFGAMTARQLLDDASRVKNTSGGDVMILSDERTYEVDAENRATETLHRTYRVDTQKGVDGWATVSAGWYSWYEERPTIKARVVTPDGQEHVLDTKDLSEAPMNGDSANVYEDGRDYRAPLPAVTVGAVVEEEIVMKNRAPMFAAGVARQFYLGFYAGAAEKTVLVVRAPASLPLKYVSRLLPNMSVEKKTSQKIVEYRFEQGHLDMLEDADDGLPSDTPRQPYVYLSTGASWNAIASAYNDVVENKARLTDVETIVKQTVKAGDSREETIRKLLYLVHKKARYTGVEFGDAALVPAYPGETLKRGYGDCKDKALLLVAMLRAAGIPAQLALLAAGTGEDIEPEMPAMYFNHAIVHVPGPPEMWIDATAESLRFGTLPTGDSGRLALIVDKGTHELVHTPEPKPEDNKQFETREFVLAEEGAAEKVIEISRPTGVAEEWFRDNYGSTDKKKAKEGWESYVKDAYSAEKLLEISQSDAADLTNPFELRLVAQKCERAWTNDEKADVVIPAAVLYGRLPEFLRGQDKETRQDTKTGKPKKPRTTDYVFTPFVTEWEYHIIPPFGYRARALPQNETAEFGPARLSRNFSTKPDGSVVARLSFDSVKGRYTPQESEAIREAIRKFEEKDATRVTFDNIGHALLAEGKIPEGLKQYEEVSAKHPKEALHRSQVAQAFVEVGLCETARKEARAATELDPKSARAFRELAWVLQHDMVCRRLRGEFDYDGAVAAYRKSIALDPADVYTHVNLAILLEHGKDGMQYSATSHLPEAIAEYKAVREMDKEVAQKYELNLLFDLMYSKQFEGLRKELASGSMDATRRAMMLTATTNLEGAQGAIDESLRLTQDEATRSTTLADAARFLLHMRMYPEAADLMTAAAKTQSNSAVALQQADIYRQTKRIESSPYPDSDPRSVVFKSIYDGISPSRMEGIVDVLSRSSWQGRTLEELLEVLRKESAVGQLRAQIVKTGTPAEVIADIALSHLQLSIEGDDVIGYHVVIQGLGAQNQSSYVLKEGNKYYMVGLKEPVADLGAIVLRHLKNGNLEAARKILDWARADVSIMSADDPLAGWAFPHLWTRGDPADPDKMRYAALSMVAARKDAKQWIPEIMAARDDAKSDSDRVYLEDSLTNAYVIGEDWANVRESALRQLKVYPRSNSVLSALGIACGHLQDWDTWSKAIEARLAIIPDDPGPLREKARWYERESKFEEASAIWKKMIDLGVGGAADRNQYAWNSLAMHKVTQDSIDQARQAMSTTKNYSIVHTLASLYAEQGHSREAQQLVIELMNDNGMEAPDSNLWYVFGRIAENYQQPQAALACYKRVEWKEKFAPDPLSTYALAKERIGGLGGSIPGTMEAK
jgi:transglutaminase-like putative cysteine protease/tetratricopeptide (TPR) repeat protein